MAKSKRKIKCWAVIANRFDVVYFANSFPPTKQWIPEGFKAVEGYFTELPPTRKRK